MCSPATIAGSAAFPMAAPFLIANEAGGGGSPPVSPDYVGAAQQQGAENRATAQLQGKINNPNVISPYGSQTVTPGTSYNQPAYEQAMRDYQHWKAISDPWTLQYGPFPMGNKNGPTPEMFVTSGDPNRPTITQTLSPSEQAIFDQSNKARLGLGSLANQGISGLTDVVGKPVDFSQIGTTADKTYNALMSRFNEDYGHQGEALNSKLIASGLRPGSKAYDDQMALLARTRTDAEIQAQQQSRKDAIAEMLMQRQVPLNEITALMSGSQVSNPFAMPGYASNTQVAPAPLFAANQAAGQYGTDVYNAQQARNAQLMQGLFGLGGSGLMAAGMAA